MPLPFRNPVSQSDDNSQTVKPPDLDANGNPEINLSITRQAKPPDLDANGKPISDQSSDIPISTTPTPDTTQPNLLSRLWSDISHPLTNIPSELVSKVAEPLMEYGESEPGALRKSALYGGAFLQSLGNQISGLTSPLNLGMMASTGGASALSDTAPGISNILNQTSRVLSAPVALHGGYQLLNPENSPIQRLSALPEIAGGLLGLRGMRSSGSVASTQGPITEDVVRQALADMKPVEAPTAETETSVPTQTLPTSIPSSTRKPIIYVKDLNNTELLKTLDKAGYKADGTIRDDGAIRMVPTPEPIQPLNSQSGSVLIGPRNPDLNETSTNTSNESTGPGLTTQVLNAPKTAMTGVLHFSAPLRQGLPLITHPKAYVNALGDMFRSWSSEDGFNNLMNNIQSRPLFKDFGDGSFADKSGLDLTSLNGPLNQREENMISDVMDKIPGMRRSRRAYVGFLNSLRAGAFEDIINDSDIFAGTKTNLPLAQEIGNFINVASGRGSLGKLTKYSGLLNNALFSPRLISSRLTMLNPAYYIMANPIVRKEALKSLFAVAAVGNVMGQLAKFGGGEVSSDPNSSDFGKIKLGPVRIDPYAGFQQYVVAASRMLSGNYDTTSGRQDDLNNPRFGGPNQMDVLSNFAHNKANPAIGFAWSLLAGAKRPDGSKMNLTNMNPMENDIAKLFIPIVAQDMYDLYKSNPELVPFMAPLSTFGMGVQTYGGGNQ